jgi:hypothetical protein
MSHLPHLDAMPRRGRMRMRAPIDERPMMNFMLV